MHRFSITGDLVLARGIDQVLDFPGSPELKESFVKDARYYVQLTFNKLKKMYPRGNHDLLDGNKILSEIFPKKPISFWLTNLETSLTRSSHFYPKGINYRANPSNVYFLKNFEKQIKCPLILALANNHILDYGTLGLLETLQTLRQNHLSYVGAGQNEMEARKPLVVGNIFRIYSTAHPSSGVPLDWKAEKDKAGIFLISDFKEALHYFRGTKSDKNLIKILMIHYGPNWQDKIDPEFQKFCYSLIDQCGFRVIVNTSPHHIIVPVEKYKDGIICYSPGDFVNDYYGIDNPKHDRFLPDYGSILEVEISSSSMMMKFVSRFFKRVGFRLKNIV